MVKEMRQRGLFDASPVLDRLQAQLRREGFDVDWRLHPGNTKAGRLLPVPSLDVGPRLRTEELALGERAGLPAQGAWETLCDWHINISEHCPEYRYGYAGRNDPGVNLWDEQELMASRERTLRRAREQWQQSRSVAAPTKRRF